MWNGGPSPSAAWIRSRRGVAGLAAALVLALTSCGGGGGDDAGASGDTGPRCASHADCSDDVFCNGAERCDPSATGAGADGCVAGVPPCIEGACDEGEDACVADCGATPDADGDGHDALVCGGDDCDDSDASRYPSAVEICDPDNVDEDCDPSTFGERDLDGDGSFDARCCNASVGGVIVCGDDCDDSVPEVNGGAAEICDGLDNDCDTATDEAGEPVRWYVDDDGDGFGDPERDAIESCALIPGRVLLGTDCDDARASASPAAREETNGRDDDCDGEIDEAFRVRGDIRALSWLETGGRVTVRDLRLESVERVCRGTVCVRGGISP